MHNLLIKLNIFALLLILPLQGYAAAGMVLCQKMNGGAVMQNKDASSADAQNMARPSDKMPCHSASAASADNSAGDTTNSVCPHCFTCGIYSPALMTSVEPVTVPFVSRDLYVEFQSHFTSFIPQSPLHPPSAG
jgi:hypothetical protein